MGQTALSFEDGGTALVRDPRQVPHKKRKMVSRAQLAMGIVGSDLDDDATDGDKTRAATRALAEHPELYENYRDSLILCLVADWSYGEVSQDALDELPVSTYDALLAHCEPLSKQMSPDFSVTPDPKANTDESNG